MDSLFQLESMDNFRDVCEQLINNLYNSKEESLQSFEKHKIQEAKNDLKEITFNNNYDVTVISEYLHNKGYDREKVEYLVSLLEKMRSELLYSSFIHHNSCYGESIVSFDWLLKMVFGTNELKTLHYPLLQLIFSTISSNGGQKQRVYDINKDMLSKLINILENVEL